MHNRIIGVDLAKKEIQVATYIQSTKTLESNVVMSPNEFTLFLAKSEPCTIVFEACATSNYWLQTAFSFEHDAYLISAKLVSTVRQNQKTDKNDALAVIQAALLPDVKFINGKSTEQQELQTIMRLRELAVQQKVALTNQIGALLGEFNIYTNQKGGLRAAVYEVLEDAEECFSTPLREGLETAYNQLLTICASISSYDTCLEQSIKLHPECEKLLKLEGIGIINAINLYILLACCGITTFAKGRDAAACVGVTPIQHSSGGKVKLGTIGKFVKNSMTRSQLICGCMAAVRQMVKRNPKTKKDLWVQNLVLRRGMKCAAVALANKTVRTAFAMLNNGTSYKAELIKT